MTEQGRGKVNGQTKGLGYPGRGLHGSVVEALGRRIVEGHVAPGEILPIEAALANEADVSRTVVREALRVLASKGLIEARPMRGTLVRERADWRSLDPDILRWSIGSEGQTSLLRDLLDIRVMIEPAAARLAALRASDLDRQRIAEAGRVLAASTSDPEDFISADLALHTAILSATHNLLVSEFVAGISTALRLGRSVQAGSLTGRRPDPILSIPAHEAVVDAIIRGDAERAEAAMASVVGGARRDVERAIGRRRIDAVDPA